MVPFLAATCLAAKPPAELAEGMEHAALAVFAMREHLLQSGRVNTVQKTLPSANCKLIAEVSAGQASVCACLNTSGRQPPMVRGVIALFATLPLHCADSKRMGASAGKPLKS